jgi:hypothetical protein
LYICTFQILSNIVQWAPRNAITVYISIHLMWSHWPDLSSIK